MLLLCAFFLLYLFVVVVVEESLRNGCDVTNNAMVARCWLDGRMTGNGRETIVLVQRHHRGSLRQVD